MIASSQPIALPQHYHHQSHHHQPHHHQGHPGLPIPSGSGSGSVGDYAMHDAQGSYTGSSEGTFNPASYARHFLGSPISWRAGSWGARFPAGSPTAQLLSSIDDFRSGKTPSSGDNDSLMNALNIFEREGELCRNYTCCGLHLTDLHALLEHFEEVHIVMLDQGGSAQPQPHIQIPFNPIAHENHSGQPHDLAQEAHQHHQHQQQMQNQQQHQPIQVQHQSMQYGTSFDPDDIEMELDLDLDNSASSTNPTNSMVPPPPPPSSAHSSLRSSPSSCAPSPPDTPISTPLSAYPSPHPFVPHLPLQGHHSHSHSNLHSPYISAPSSPLSSAYDPSTAASTRQNSPTHGSMHPNGSVQHQHRPNLNLNLNVAHTGVGGFPRATPAPSSTLLTHPEEAFNTYARFASDYSSSMPGAQFNGAAVDEGSAVSSISVGMGMGWQQQMPGQSQSQQQGGGGGCVPPALLFASTTSVQGKEEAQSQPQSRVSSPGGAHGHGHGKKNGVLSGLSKHSTHTRLGAATAPSTPTSTSPTSSSSSALPSSSHHPSSATPSSTTSTSTTSPSSTALRPQPSLLLSKPFRCPKPNCNKSYKQANGLKYHMTHGSCNFAPPKDLEHVKDLLERKRREREASANGGGQGNGGNGGLHRSASLGSVPGGSNGASSSNAHLDPNTSSQTTPSTPTTPLSPTSILSLTYSDLSQIPEAELREVEREAERRLRPFACGVGECTRRYKNMNGLRYHYQHSGDHGALGLALLASGQHECLGWGRRGGKGVQGGGQGAGPNTSGSGVMNGVNGTRIAGLGMGGSVSMPVSRAGSVSVTSSVANSRVGTPQPVPPLPSLPNSASTSSTTSSPNASSATSGASSSNQQQQQLQQQHLAQLQAMQAQIHQQQQAQLAMHQQQYGQASASTSAHAQAQAQAQGAKPTVQAQAFVVPSTSGSTMGHQRTGSNGSSNGSPQNAYTQVPIQHTSPQQPHVPAQTQAQPQMQVTSPQQQAAQAQAHQQAQQHAQAQHQAAQQAHQAYAAAYSAYAQQMYVRAHVQAAAQHQAQAQAQVQGQAQPQPTQQPQQTQQGGQEAGSGSPTQANGVIFNASGEYVGGSSSDASSSSAQPTSQPNPSSTAPSTTQQQQQPLSPQHAQFAHMSLSSPTMASPTQGHSAYGHYEQQQAQAQQAQAQGAYEQQSQQQGAYEQGQSQGYEQQQQGYEQQGSQGYHQYGMNGMDVSGMYAQGGRM